MLGYGIGLYGGRPLVYKIFSEKKIPAVERLYDCYNAWATGIAGLTPIPYKVFTIAGGAFKINFKVFVLASIVSRTLRFMAVTSLRFGTLVSAQTLVFSHAAGVDRVVFEIGFQ